MSVHNTRSASQLRDFIDTNHIYVDGLDEGVIRRIRKAAEKEPEEIVSSNVTKRRGKARRSLAPRFPPEWATSKEAFLNALQKFEYKSYTATPDRDNSSHINNPHTPIYEEQRSVAGPSVARSRSRLVEPKFSIPSRETMISVVPREVMSLFSGFEKLDDRNWNTWKGHMRDNLEMCELWDLVVGNEKRPSGLYTVEVDGWVYRERIARVVIKNSLGTVDYRQVQSAKTATEIWEILMSLHQPTGAQGTVDLIWQFWSKRCVEGASVREHIGEVRATHSDLAEIGVVIDDYLLAIAMSKSLPPSYDSYVSTIFAGIKDLDQADSRYVANKIFEEEVRRDGKSEDANITSTKIFCSNCKKLGHLIENCYSKGGGKEGQGPRQIARRKKQEAEKRRESKIEQCVQNIEEDVFYSSHVM